MAARGWHLYGRSASVEELVACLLREVCALAVSGEKQAEAPEGLACGLEGVSRGAEGREASPPGGARRRRCRLPGMNICTPCKLKAMANASCGTP
eukprot:4567478-Pleurochrysis_carterae.AAC.2